MKSMAQFQFRDCIKMTSSLDSSLTPIATLRRSSSRPPVTASSIVPVAWKHALWQDVEIRKQPHLRFGGAKYCTLLRNLWSPSAEWGKAMSHYSRREFLRTGLAAGALAVTGSLPLSAERQKATDW